MSLRSTASIAGGCCCRRTVSAAARLKTTSLETAVAAAALEEWPRVRVPLDWARTQAGLGTALQTLGARESGTARLEEAVAAYRAALEERPRVRAARLGQDAGLRERALGRLAIGSVQPGARHRDLHLAEAWYFNGKFKLSGACRWCRGGALVS